LLKRSLIPGGGYFYTGHTFLAVTDLIAEVWLIFLVIISALAAHGTWGKAPAKAGAPTGSSFLFTMLLFLALLVFEKLVTIHHGRRFVREFISTGQKDPMRMHPAAAGVAGTGWK
jgi:hypothetical protein